MNIQIFHKLAAYKMSPLLFTAKSILCVCVMSQIMPLENQLSSVELCIHILFLHSEAQTFSCRNKKKTYFWLEGA